MYVHTSYEPRPIVCSHTIKLEYKSTNSFLRWHGYNQPGIETVQSVHAIL
jgi:hypothetical protein